jgi:hypothetical protein
LWRQQIQDYLIAAIQNIRILLSRMVLKPAASTAAAVRAAAVRLEEAGLAIVFNIAMAQVHLD